MYQTSPRHIRLFSSSPVSHIRFLLVHFTLSHYVSCTLVFCHKGTSVYLRPPALDCWYTLFPAGPGLYLFLSGYIPISALTTVLLVVLQHLSSFFLAAVICTASICSTNFAFPSHASAYYSFGTSNSESKQSGKLLYYAYWETVVGSGQIGKAIKKHAAQ